MRLSPATVTWIRRSIWTAAVLVTAIAVFAVVENTRGNRAWRAVEEDCRRRGETLSLEALGGAPVPDSRNFFRAPVIAALSAPQQRGNADLLPDVIIARLREAEKGGTVDVEVLHAKLVRAGVIPASNTHPPAEAVLEALNAKGATFDAFRAAARQRDLAAVHYDEFMTSRFELQRLWELSRATAFRARLELQTGRSADAYEDVLALTRFARRMSDLRPLTLMDTLVALAADGLIIPVVQLGSTTHGWDEAQLASLQAELGAVDWLAAFSDTIRSERAWMIQVIDTASTSELAQLKVSYRPLLIPGWRQQNKAAVARIAGLWLEVTSGHSGQIDAAALERLRHAETDLANSRSWLSIIARTMHRAALTKNFATDVDAIRMVHTALAAERHYLRHNTYPETVAELVTEGLLKAAPRSALTGMPILYEVGNDGRRATLKASATRGPGHTIVLGAGN